MLKWALVSFLAILVLGGVFLGVAATAAPLGYRYAASLDQLNGLPALEDADQLASWINRTIAYRSDPAGSDYWQTPEQTLASGFGDCEDMSLLFLYLARTRLGLNSKLLLVKVDGQKNVGHAIVDVNGDWYETVGGYRIRNRTRYQVAARIPYQKSLWMAERHHEWAPLGVAGIR